MWRAPCSLLPQVSSQYDPGYLGPGVALAHCVSADLAMGAGVAAQVVARWPQVIHLPTHAPATPSTCHPKHLPPHTPATSCTCQLPPATRHQVRTGYQHSGPGTVGRR